MWYVHFFTSLYIHKSLPKSHFLSPRGLYTLPHFSTVGYYRYTACLVMSCPVFRYVLISCMKSILHFGLMRLEEFAEDDNNNNHNNNNNNYDDNETTRGTSALHHQQQHHQQYDDTSSFFASLMTLLRYSTHLALVTGVTVMSVKFWTAIYHVSGNMSSITVVYLLVYSLFPSLTPTYYPSLPSYLLIYL